jgi:hypothetical protein
MGILSGLASIFTGGASEVVTSAGSVLDNLFTSDEEREEAKRLMAVVEDKPHQDQRDINKVEAATAGKWSWHNALGWMLVICLGTFYIPQHVVAAAVWVKSCYIYFESINLSADTINALTLPDYPIDAKGIWELVVAMLGLAGKVTYERVKGVRPSWRP